MDYGDLIDAGNIVVASVCWYGFRARNEQSVAGLLRLLDQVVNVSELVLDGVQRAFENWKEGLVVVGSCFPTPRELVKPSFLRRVFICIDVLDELLVKHELELWESSQ